MSKIEISDVSDTALWVAVYRARESERKDALFHDPLARRLAGDHGHRIANWIKGSHFVAWSVVIRTHIIDSYIQNLVAEGVDTVLNLGAGLDTRPYRMDLPKSLRWVEVDFPRIIEMKEKQLQGEIPRCQLERIKLDLNNGTARRKFFSEINRSSKKVLVLTEGVVPYLTNDQVDQLAHDLRLQSNFNYWILDYLSSEITKMMKRKRAKQMVNAPFQFEPQDWFEFFKKQGWTSREIRYLGEESEKLGRPIPLPWFIKLLKPIIPKKQFDKFKKFTAYVLLQPG